MFEKKDIAEYYNTTQTHYEQWWNLKKHLSLHYGIWDEKTKTFGDAIINTNKILLKLSQISGTDKVLDAGCGVGGAAFFINKSTNAKVIGISLSEKQISLAKKTAIDNNVEDKVEFHIMDFTNTTFPSESFDVIWACESVCHASNKVDFIEECFRLLKKGGRLILCDFFLTDTNQDDKKQWIYKWKTTWAVQDFVTKDYFVTNLQQKGFHTINTWNHTDDIRKSAKRLYYASLIGFIPSIIYNLFHPNISRFAKTHYKCGYYQYRALNENLWNYNIILAEK